jgi:hypothetical protein
MGSRSTPRWLAGKWLNRSAQVGTPRITAEALITADTAVPGTRARLLTDLFVTMTCRSLPPEVCDLTVPETMLLALIFMGGIHLH